MLLSQDSSYDDSSDDGGSAVADGGAAVGARADGMGKAPLHGSSEGVTEPVSGGSSLTTPVTEPSLLSSASLVLAIKIVDAAALEADLERVQHLLGFSVGKDVSTLPRHAISRLGETINEVLLAAYCGAPHFLQHATTSVPLASLDTHGRTAVHYAVLGWLHLGGKDDFPRWSQVLDLVVAQDSNSSSSSGGGDGSCCLMDAVDGDRQLSPLALALEACGVMVNADGSLVEVVDSGGDVVADVVVGDDLLPKRALVMVHALVSRRAILGYNLRGVGAIKSQVLKDWPSPWGREALKLLKHCHNLREAGMAWSPSSDFSLTNTLLLAFYAKVSYIGCGSGVDIVEGEEVEEEVEAEEDGGGGPAASDVVEEEGGGGGAAAASTLGADEAADDEFPSLSSLGDSLETEDISSSSSSTVNNAVLHSLLRRSGQPEGSFWAIEHKEIRCLVIRTLEHRKFCPPDAPPDYPCYVVAFRGTATTGNWKVNMIASKTDLGTRGKCHTGFRRALMTLWPTIRQLLPAPPGHEGTHPRIILTGHSLGGAMATLAAEQLHSMGYHPDRLLLYAFASPRVGDHHFQQRFDNTFRQAYVVVRDKDPVPTVPPHSLGFWHCGSVRALDAQGRLFNDLHYTLHDVRRRAFPHSGDVSALQQTLARELRQAWAIGLQQRGQQVVLTEADHDHIALALMDHHRLMNAAAHHSMDAYFQDVKALQLLLNDYAVEAGAVFRPIMTTARAAEHLHIPSDWLTAEKREGRYHAEAEAALLQWVANYTRPFGYEVVGAGGGGATAATRGGGGDGAVAQWFEQEGAVLATLLREERMLQSLRRDVSSSSGGGGSGGAACAVADEGGGACVDGDRHGDLPATVKEWALACGGGSGGPAVVSPFVLSGLVAVIDSAVAVVTSSSDDCSSSDGGASNASSSFLQILCFRLFDALPEAGALALCSPASTRLGRNINTSVDSYGDGAGVDPVTVASRSSSSFQGKEGVMQMMKSLQQCLARIAVNCADGRADDGGGGDGEPGAGRCGLSQVQLCGMEESAYRHALLEVLHFMRGRLGHAAAAAAINTHHHFVLPLIRHQLLWRPYRDGTRHGALASRRRWEQRLQQCLVPDDRGNISNCDPRMPEVPSLQEGVRIAFLASGGILHHGWLPITKTELMRVRKQSAERFGRRNVWRLEMESLPRPAAGAGSAAGGVASGGGSAASGSTAPPSSSHGKMSFHVKEFPEMAGMERATCLLFQRVMGGGAPHSLVGRLDIPIDAADRDPALVTLEASAAGGGLGGGGAAAAGDKRGKGKKTKKAKPLKGKKKGNSSSSNVGGDSPQWQDVMTGQWYECVPILLTETVVGKNFEAIVRKSKQLQRLHRQRFSQLFLGQLLTLVEDGKPENLMVTELPRHPKAPGGDGGEGDLDDICLTRGVFPSDSSSSSSDDGTDLILHSIDNDHVLIPPFVMRQVGKAGVLGRKRVLFMKSVLFCLDNMLDAVDPLVQQDFLSLNIEDVLQGWLRDLAAEDAVTVGLQHVYRRSGRVVATTRSSSAGPLPASSSSSSSASSDDNYNSFVVAAVGLFSEGENTLLMQRLDEKGKAPEPVLMRALFQRGMVHDMYLRMRSVQTCWRHSLAERHDGSAAAAHDVDAVPDGGSASASGVVVACTHLETLQHVLPEVGDIYGAALTDEKAKGAWRRFRTLTKDLCDRDKKQHGNKGDDAEVFYTKMQTLDVLESRGIAFESLLQDPVASRELTAQSQLEALNSWVKDAQVALLQELMRLLLDASTAARRRTDRKHPFVVAFLDASVPVREYFVNKEFRRLIKTSPLEMAGGDAALEEVVAAGKVRSRDDCEALVMMALLREEGGQCCRRLALSQWQTLNDALLLRLLRSHGPYLEKLLLRGCRSIRKLSMGGNNDVLPLLRYLDIRECPGLQQWKAVEKMTCPKLSTLLHNLPFL